MINCFGISFRFHPLFVLVMMCSVATGYFLELITLFGIVLIHELGHVAAARGYGWNVREIQLLPFGGVARIDSSGSVTAWKEIVVALAGPLQNGLMILLAKGMQQLGYWGDEWGNYFILSNLIIALFNLLPILPLDGGKVLQALVSRCMSYHRTILYCSVVSLFFSFAFALTSVMRWHSFGLQMNQLIIGLFLLYSNWYGYRNLPYYFFRFLMGKSTELSRMTMTGADVRSIAVHANDKISRIARLIRREKYHLIYVLGEGGTIQGTITEHRLLHGYFIEKKAECAVSDLFM